MKVLEVFQEEVLGLERGLLWEWWVWFPRLVPQGRKNSFCVLFSNLLFIIIIYI